MIPGAYGEGGEELGTEIFSPRGLRLSRYSQISFLPNFAKIGTVRARGMGMVLEGGECPI